MSGAFRIYAEEHGHRLPPTLGALVPGSMSQEVLAAHRFINEKNEERDWLYFPREKLDGLPLDTIILAAPGISLDDSGKPCRLVMKPDLSTDCIPEDYFQRLIREQNPPSAK